MNKVVKQEIHYYFSNYILNRNEKNLEEIYIKYKPLVYKIAFSFLKSIDDAEDVVQNVFLKIHNIDSKQLPREFENSWLYKVTKNESINILKKNNKNVNIDEIYSISDKNDLINKIINIEDFNNLIKKLPEKDREVVSLKIISGMSFKKISKLLDMPLGTVEWRYYKSINHLKLIINNFIICIVTLCAGIVRSYKQKQEVNEKSNISKEENSNYISQENTSNVIDEFADREINNETNETAEEIMIENREVKPDIITKGLFSTSLIFFIIIIIVIIHSLKHKIRIKNKNNIET